MKTTFSVLIIMGIVGFMVLTTQAQSTVNPGPNKDNTFSTNTNGSGSFADKNNNGKCDNFEARQKNGHGRNFIDKDGDGICDNNQSKGVKGSKSIKQGRFCRQGNARGNGNGNCNGNGCGRGNGIGNRCGGNPASQGNLK